MAVIVGSDYLVSCWLFDCFAVVADDALPALIVDCSRNFCAIFGISTWSLVFASAAFSAVVCQPI